MAFAKIFRSKVAWIIFLVSLVSSAWSQDQTQPESTPKAAKPTFLISPRFNSAGHFPFSGALINNHPNFDINVFYEKKGNGFFVFKSQDLKDSHSIVNYLQPGISKKFKLRTNLRLGIFFGYVFSQTEGFKDKDSDYFTAAVIYWTITDRLKLENTALFFDLSQSVKLANRTLLSYTLKEFKFDIYVWERIVFEADAYATSASFAINFPKIRLSDALHIQNTISYQGYLTPAKPEWALRRGLLISVAFPISISK